MSDFDFDEIERRGYVRRNTMTPATRLEVAERLYGKDDAPKVVAVMDENNFSEEVFQFVQPIAQEAIMQQFMSDWIVKNGK